MAQAVNEPMSFTERTRQFRALVDQIILWARNSNIESLRRWSRVAEDCFQRTQAGLADFPNEDEQSIFAETVRSWH